MHETMGRRLRLISIGVVVLPLILALCTASVVLAATRLVAPGGTDSGDCTATACATIAYALGKAADGEAISVAAGSYSQHDIAVTKSVTIAGAGAGTTTVDAGSLGRVFSVSSGKTVTISGLTITRGAPAVGANGGAILNQGTLTLTNDAITASHLSTNDTFTIVDGGGIANDIGGTLTLNSTSVTGNTAGIQTGNGGGISNRGTLTITGGTISGNIAQGGVGGGIASIPGATIQISNATISANKADSYGMGIFVGRLNEPLSAANGSLTLDHVSVTNHTLTSTSAAGRYPSIQLLAPGYGMSMALTMTNTTVSGNTGGGLFWSELGTCFAIADSTISNNGVNTSNSGASLYNDCSATNTIARTVISGNQAYSNTQNFGLGTGGLDVRAPTTITDSQITGNRGLNGGMLAGGTITVTNTVISNNQSVVGGVTNARANYAGGIYAGGTLTLTNSTISDNASDYDVGGISAANKLTLTNSTISGNSSPYTSAIVSGAATGSGFTATNSTISGNTGSVAIGLGLGAGTLVNTTVAANTAGIRIDPAFGGAGPFTVTNSILANTGLNCPGPSTIASGGYNVVSDLSCGFAGGGTDLTNTDPKIAALANNGGPTLTHALLASSPAIDRIPNTGGCNGAGLTTDQRGQPRPQPAGGLCDVGAYEAGPSPPPTPTNLHVTGATYNSLTWSWSESDATAPLIYTVDGSHFYGLAAGTTSFTLYGIAYGSYACMAIAAYNSVGSSGYTPYSCSYVVPIAPYNPHQTAGTTSTGTISWANYDTLSSEQVYDYSGAAWHQVGVNGTSYTLTGIPAGYYHCAAVQAYNVNYASGYSYACPFATPNAPTNIHATSVSSTSVTFAWTAPDPYSWYYVYETAPSVGHVVSGTSFTTTHIIVSGQHGYACIYVGAGGYGGTSSTFPYACAWAY